MLDLKEFADIALRFMMGLPGPFSAGYTMMGPDELRRQRWTYVKYWLRRIDEISAQIGRS